jgi:hypothetical protein
MKKTIRVFLETTTIIFVILKLFGIIDWSWWLVLSPTWVPLLFSIPLIGIALLIKKHLENPSSNRRYSR